jgi:hypothetical protein
MKNFAKWFGIVAFVAAIWLSMAACDDGSGGPGGGGGGGSGAAKTITITGLTGMGGSVEINVESDSITVAHGKGTISNNSVTFTLYSGIKGDSPWTGSGSYYLHFIYEDGPFFGKNIYFYSDGKTNGQLGIDDSSLVRTSDLRKLPKYNFSSASSTIPFSKFGVNCTFYF